MEKPYDYSLDAIKGFSCLLMILAHTSLEFSGGVRGVQIFGGLAPVLFFAASGVTSTFQGGKRLLPVLSFYFIFAILGLSYNAVWHPSIWSGIVSDVPQIIAMGVIGIILFEKYARPGNFVYLLSALLLFALHLVITPRIPHFPAQMFLLPQGEVKSFTLIPWLSVFLLGVFAYRSSKSVNIIGALASGALLIISYITTPAHAAFLSKYNMSLGYFFLSSFVLFLSFFLFRIRSSYSRKNPLIFFGKHSFLFLYVHLFVLDLLARFKLFAIPVPIVWLCVGLATFIGILLILRLNPYAGRIFNYKLAWLGLLLLVLLVPAFIHSSGAVIWAETFLGIAFACNYKKLSRIVGSLAHPVRQGSSTPRAEEKVAG